MNYLAVLAHHELPHGQHTGALPPQYHELAQVVHLTGEYVYIMLQ